MKSPFKSPIFKNRVRRALTPRATSRSFFWHRSGKRGMSEISNGGRMDAADPHASQKKATFLERAWRWIHTTFPERQIYIRSDGRVQFFTFGPSLQATLAGLGLIFLMWVAFATVNVVFKDRIITAKDDRYQQMQAAYENRVADLQSSYDELNGALVSAEDRFKATADALQTKQNAIAGFLNRANQVQAAVGVRTSVAPAPLPSLAPLARGEAPRAGGLDVEAPSDINADDVGSSQLVVMPGPAQPQPRTARPIRSGMLDH